MSGLPLAEHLRHGDHQALQIAAPLQPDVGPADGVRVAGQRLVARLVLAGLLRLLVEGLRDLGRLVGVLLRHLGARLRARVVVLLQLGVRLRQHVAGGAVLGLRVLRRIDRLGGAQRELRRRDLLLARQLQRQPFLLRLRLLLLGGHLLPTAAACPPRRSCAPRRTSAAAPASRSRSPASPRVGRTPPRALACSADSVWIFAFSCSCSISASAVLSLMFAISASRRESSRSFDCHSSRAFSPSFSALATRLGRLLRGLLDVVGLAQQPRTPRARAAWAASRTPPRAAAAAQARRGAMARTFMACSTLSRPFRSLPSTFFFFIVSVERLLVCARSARRHVGQRGLALSAPGRAASTP